MNSLRLHLAVLVLLGAAAAGAQDAVKVAPDHYAVKMENAQVRVVELSIKPGEKDKTHTHPAGWFYVTRGGKLKITHADGKIELWEPKAGESGWMEAEAPHMSENVGSEPMGVIIVEVKSAATSTKR